MSKSVLYLLKPVFMGGFVAIRVVRSKQLAVFKSILGRLVGTVKFTNKQNCKA